MDKIDIRERREIMDSESLFPRMPSIRTARVFLALAIFTSILSGTSGGQFFCDMIAAVTGSIALLSLPGPSIGKMIRNALLLGLVCLIGAGAASYYVTKKLLFHSVAALTPAFCMLAISLSIYKLRSRSFTVTLTALIMLIMLVLTVLAGRYDSVGSLSLASIKDLLTSFENSMREMIRSRIGEDTLPMLDDTTLDRMIRIVEYLFPFVLYVLYFLCAYVITGLIRRILLGYTLGRRSLTSWLIVPSRISCVLYLIAMPFCIFTMNELLTDESSAMSVGSIICLSSLAVLLLTLPGCFAIGVRRTIFLIRTRRRFRLTGILLALFIGMIVPFFLFFYFGFAGAYHTIFDPIIVKKLQNMNPPGSDDSQKRG